MEVFSLQDLGDVGGEATDDIGNRKKAENSSPLLVGMNDVEAEEPCWVLLEGAVNVPAEFVQSVRNCDRLLIGSFGDDALWFIFDVPQSTYI